jgi:hypothetical protein
MVGKLGSGAAGIQHHVPRDWVTGMVGNAPPLGQRGTATVASSLAGNLGLGGRVLEGKQGEAASQNHPNLHLGRKKPSFGAPRAAPRGPSRPLPLVT